jgi:hypothetical protein
MYLAQFYGGVFNYSDSFTLITFVCFQISYFFGMNTTEETSSAEMCIWCTRIGIVLVLHLKRGQLLTNKLLSHGYNKPRLKAHIANSMDALTTLSAINNYHWLIY